MVDTSRGYNVNCWCCFCKRGIRDEETGEYEMIHFLDLPGPWNNGKNKIGVAIDSSHDTCISNTSVC